jgi:hypothetical protein
MQLLPGLERIPKLLHKKKIGYKEFSDAILYDIIDALATDNLEECITLLRKIFHLGKPLFLWEWNFGITI